MKKRDLEKIPEGTCKCSICGIVKDNKEYQWYAGRYTKDGYRLRVNTWCSDCSKQKQKEVREAEKSAKAMGRGRETLKDGDPCDCCGKPVYKKRSDIPEGVDGRWSFQCDHDHETGEFRGWICKTCNTGTCSQGAENLFYTAKYLGYQLVKLDECSDGLGKQSIKMRSN